MIRFYLSKSNSIVEAFLKEIFKDCLVTNSPNDNPNVYVVTESCGVNPPDWTPSAVIDCHSGARISANFDLLSWLDNFGGKKISFNSSRQGFEFRDLKLLSLPEVQFDVSSVNSGVLVILPECEYDEDVVNLFRNQIPNTTVVQAEQVKSLVELMKLLCSYSVILNPTSEVDFPIIELCAAHLGKTIITSRYGCTFEYLGFNGVYFTPGECRTYSACLAVAGFKPTNVFCLGGDLTKQLQSDLLSYNSEESVIESVEMLASQSRFDEALELLEDALKSFPDSANLRRAFGILLLSQNRFEEAKTWLLESYVLDPDNPKTLCALGIIYSNSGLVTKAREFLLKSYKTSDQPIIPLFKLIELAYKISDFDVAEACLTDYLEKVGYDNDDLVFTLAGLRYKMGKFNECKQALNVILGRNPDYEAASQLQKMIEDNDIEENNIECSDVNSEPLDSASLNVVVESEVESIIGQVEELKRSGQYVEAFKILEEQYPNQVDPIVVEKMQFLMMELKVLMGDNDFYSSNYEFFETKYPDHPRWLSIKGTVDLVNGRLEEAEDNFKKAAELNPEMDVPWAGLGLVCELREDFENAIQYYQRSLSLNPLNLRAVIGFSEICIRGNRPNEALPWVERFLAICPSSEELVELHRKLVQASHQNSETTALG